MDEQCAKILAKEDFVSRLVNLLKSKQEDDELVCQIVYVFYQMVFHQVTRDIFLQSSVSEIIENLIYFYAEVSQFLRYVTCAVL